MNKNVAAIYKGNWVTFVYNLKKLEGTHVKEDVGNEDTKVTPVVRVLDVEVVQQELIGGPERTESTVTGSIWVGQVSSGAVDEGLKELLTCLSRGRRYRCKFNVGTCDFPMTNRLAKKTFDEIGVRGEAVHPLPPAKQTEGLKDTIAI